MTFEEWLLPAGIIAQQAAQGVLLPACKIKSASMHEVWFCKPPGAYVHGTLDAEALAQGLWKLRKEFYKKHAFQPELLFVGEDLHVAIKKVLASTYAAIYEPTSADGMAVFGMTYRLNPALPPDVAVLLPGIPTKHVIKDGVQVSIAPLSAIAVLDDMSTTAFKSDWLALDAMANVKALPVVPAPSIPSADALGTHKPKPALIVGGDRHGAHLTSADTVLYQYTYVGQHHGERVWTKLDTCTPEWPHRLRDALIRVGIDPDADD